MSTEWRSLHKARNDPAGRRVIEALAEKGALSHTEIMALLQVADTERLNQLLTALGNFVRRDDQDMYHLTDQGRLAVRLLQGFRERGHPWEIGRPQPEIVRLAEAGEIRGKVLDIGCGTGENVLYLSGLGHEAVGIDISPEAIKEARRKAAERGHAAKFIDGNALILEKLKTRFDSVIDSGFFHTLSDRERRTFERSLAEVTRQGGTYFMLCFSEHEPSGWGGPRRITQGEIREVFGSGWHINYIREAHFETTWPEIAGSAWLSSITAIRKVHRGKASEAAT